MDFNDTANVITATMLKEAGMRVHLGLVLRPSRHLPPEAIICTAAVPDIIYCGPRAYRMILWETSEKVKWVGRDHRRIKREHRKFLRAKDPTHAR